jgi:hypothetical protein
MALSGDVRINQDGVIPSARTLTNATPLDVAMVDGNGDQLTGFDPSRPSASTITAVPLSVTSVVLSAADPARRELKIYNDSNRTLLIAEAATASAAAFTVRVPGNGFYELGKDGYTGVVSGIWTQAGTGNAMVTKHT